MYLRMGNSESSGETSPKSDLKGAPNRRSAVGELSSEISHLTCSEMSSRFKSRDRPVSQRMLQDPGRIYNPCGGGRTRDVSRRGQRTVFLLSRQALFQRWRRGRPDGEFQRLPRHRPRFRARLPLSAAAVHCHIVPSFQALIRNRRELSLGPERRNR